MRPSCLFALLVALLALAAACSNGSPSPDAGADGAAPDGSQPATSCTFDYDCPNGGQRCFFPVDGHCTVAGQSGVCMDFTAPDPCTPTVGCGCDGTTISVCAPAGYVDRASNFAGPCPSDAGATD